MEERNEFYMPDYDAWEKLGYGYEDSYEDDMYIKYWLSSGYTTIRLTYSKNQPGYIMSEKLSYNNMGDETEVSLTKEESDLIDKESERVKEYLKEEQARQLELVKEFKPDYEAWSKLGYKKDEEKARGTFYQWRMSKESNGGFESNDIIIDFDLNKGPSSIRVMKWYASRIDPAHEIPFEDPTEIELANKEKAKAKEFLANLEA